jgi:hypothetical protein
VRPFRIIYAGNDSVRGSAEFNDNGAGSGRFRIDILLDSYTFSQTAARNYIILKYSLINNSADILSNLYSGLFFDWDLAGGPDDFTSYDADGKLGFVHNQANDSIPWVAAAVVSGTGYGFWGINNAGGDDGFSIYDGFSDAEKFRALSGGIGKYQAGPGDISFVVSTGPNNIGPSDTLNIGFAIAGGLDLEELRTAVSDARIKYKTIINDTTGSEIPDKFSLYQNYPNPFNPNTRISYSIPEQSNVSLKIYDILGNEVQTIINRLQPAGKYTIEFKSAGLASGVYFYRIQAGSFSEVKKMLILK